MGDLFYFTMLSGFDLDGHLGLRWLDWPYTTRI